MRRTTDLLPVLWWLLLHNLAVVEVPRVREHRRRREPGARPLHRPEQEDVARRHLGQGREPVTCFRQNIRTQNGQFLSLGTSVNPTGASGPPIEEGLCITR